MRLMKLLTTTTVAVMAAAALSVSASAALTATPAAGNGSVTLGGATVSNGTQRTVLITKDVALNSVTDNDIVYINQAADTESSAFASAIPLPANLEVGHYNVYLGNGANGIEDCVMKLYVSATEVGTFADEGSDKAVAYKVTLNNTTSAKSWYATIDGTAMVRETAELPVTEGEATYGIVIVGNENVTDVKVGK